MEEGGRGGDDSMRELFLHEREVTGQNTHIVPQVGVGQPSYTMPRVNIKYYYQPEQRKNNSSGSKNVHTI